MENLLAEARFDYLSAESKAFIRAFDAEMNLLGYNCGGQAGPGFCWGRHMLIYTKTGVTSEKVYARLYLREDEIALRLFFNQVDRQRAFIEAAPAHIQAVFTGPHGECQHCKNEKDGACRFRKTYTLHGRFIEKCNGLTFEFSRPALAQLPDYLALFCAFYPPKKGAGKAT